MTAEVTPNKMQGEKRAETETGAKVWQRWEEQKKPWEKLNNF